MKNALKWLKNFLWYSVAMIGGYYCFNYFYQLANEAEEELEFLPLLIVIALVLAIIFPRKTYYD